LTINSIYYYARPCNRAGVKYFCRSAGELYPVREKINPAGGEIYPVREKINPAGGKIYPVREKIYPAGG
jgi:uncharacterized protein YbaR (Trm112 family)